MQVAAVVQPDRMVQERLGISIRVVEGETRMADGVVAQELTSVEVLIQMEVSVSRDIQDTNTTPFQGMGLAEAEVLVGQEILDLLVETEEPGETTAAEVVEAHLDVAEVVRLEELLLEQAG